MMTFKQLLKTNTWLTISSKFSEIYPEAEKNISGYQTVFENLLIMSPEETDISIVITKEKHDDDEYIDVSGLYNNPKNIFSQKKTKLVDNINKGYFKVF